MFLLIVVNFYTLNKFVYNGRSKLFHLCKFHKSLIEHLHINSLLLKFNESFFIFLNLRYKSLLFSLVFICHTGITLIG